MDTQTSDLRPRTSGVYRCPGCGREFGALAALRVHYRGRFHCRVKVAGIAMCWPLAVTLGWL